MRADLIVRIGIALYGPSWRSKLAEELGMGRRTVYDWSRGHYRPSPEARAKLIALLRKNSDEMIELLRELQASD